MRFILQNGAMLPFIDSAIEHAKDRVKEQIHEYIMAGLAASFDVAKELSFSIALIGGGICLIVYVLTGVRRAGKAFAVLVVGHALIRYLIGGGVG